MAGGCGIAAAAGLFDPPKPPRQALAFQSSTNPATIPGATLQLSLPGPEGVTLQVVTDTVTTTNQTVSCVALGIIGPDGQPASTHGNAMCSGLAAPVGSTVPTQQQLTPSGALESWRAPSRTSYDLVFGQSIPGVAEVTLASTDGEIGAREPANSHGYVIYIPSSRFADYGHLVFTDKSGNVLFSENMSR